MRRIEKQSGNDRCPTDEKWGRYRYRPHSHWRWALERTLIAWRVSFCSSPEGFGHQDMSPGARAGAEPVPGQSGGARPVPTGLAACPQPRLLPWRLERFALQQAAHVPIDAGVHYSGHPMIGPRGLNGPGWCRPKAPLSLSYPAMMLSSRRVRFGFRLPVSAGDPGR